MNLKDAQAALRPHGMVMKKTGEGNEHRVNYKGGKEDTAYYSDDRMDAFHTAHKMAEELRMKGQGSHDPIYPSSKKNK
jgi:hypothetical protein